MATLKMSLLWIVCVVTMAVGAVPNATWAVAIDVSAATDMVADGKFQEPPLSHAVEQQIFQAAREVETLHSDFVQEKYLSMFEEKLVSTGQFYYQRPDLLRWELLTPIASGFVIKGDGGRRWHQSIAGSEAFKLNQDKAMALIAQQLFAWAKADLVWLHQHYTITMVTSADDLHTSAEQPIQLRLVPPADSAGFLRYLLITFAADASYVARVEIHENDGDYTRINFNNTTVNNQIDNRIFADRLSE